MFFFFFYRSQKILLTELVSVRSNPIPNPFQKKKEEKFNIKDKFSLIIISFNLDIIRMQLVGHILWTAINE